MRLLKRLTLGLVVLLAFDALANGGALRRAAGGEVKALAVRVSQANWHGLG